MVVAHGATKYLERKIRKRPKNVAAGTFGLLGKLNDDPVSHFARRFLHVSLD